MVYIGIDVHRKQSHLAALGEDGQVVLSRRVRTRPEEFCLLLARVLPFLLLYWCYVDQPIGNSQLPALFSRS